MQCLQGEGPNLNQRLFASTVKTDYINVVFLFCCEPPLLDLLEHKGDHYLSILIQPLGNRKRAVFINDQNIFADMNSLQSPLCC